MSSNILDTLKIRNGTAGDLPLVKKICAGIEGDYVPYVWLEWANDPQNQLYVFELDGEPAAIYCLRIGYAGPNSSWIQGVRVATAFKKRGIAAAIIEHAITISRSQNLKAVRYSTAEPNSPMHRLAERYGFRLTGKYLGEHLAEPNSPGAGLRYQPISLSELDEAYKLITDSEEYRAAEGFYCDAWWWRPLSREVLQEHIEKGEVVRPEKAFDALAILTPGEEVASYWLSFLAGKPAQQEALLEGIITNLTRQTPNGQPLKIDSLLPKTAWNEALLKKTGFIPYEDADSVMYLYERILSSELF